MIGEKLKRAFGMMMCGLLLTGAAFAQTDKRIDAIRAAYEKSAAAVAICEADGEASPTYLLETVVNKNDGQYPAVGTYRITTKYYYTYGNREENPYPDKLTFVKRETRRSDRTKLEEYLFDDAGRLVFFYETDEDGAEHRIYFDRAVAIKMLTGTNVVALAKPESRAAAASALKHAQSLSLLFKRLTTED